MAILHVIPQKENKENKNHNHDNNNYYYTRVRAREMEDISECYQDALGRPMPRFTVMEVQDYLDAGIHADMICAILAQTAGAPRPSWAYARAVIDRQAAMGARTKADFDGNVKAWRERAAAGADVYRVTRARGRVQEQGYAQRQYDPEEYDAIPDELLAEMRRTHG